MCSWASERYAFLWDLLTRLDFQERIAVLLYEKESLAKELAESRSDDEVLRARMAMLEMQLEEKRLQAIEDEEEREKGVARCSELKDQLSQTRLELEIYRERVRFL